MSYALPPDAEPCVPCTTWLDDLEVQIAANEHAIGLVSPRPRAVGAAVVLPRAHVHSPSALSVAQVAGLWRVVQQVTRSIEAAYDPDGMHTWHDIGTETSASFAHLSVDLVPRRHHVPYRYRPYAELADSRREERVEAARILRGAVR
jgi:diadenosine tetraphosphate (Ap4A) HIT family hydrolase